MKRVVNLYRVSSLGQVEKDDIPMQKQACREFAERQGWVVVGEFSEKGISGYKVSAKDRDAIQDIQKLAVKKEFDVLLVFMFDRIGRIDSETPFVVEWFIHNGIEVWSVNEGEQRLDNHTDKLLNYIRYWQASGESIKTSVRTKTRLSQLAQEGRYYGGNVPFGYRLVKKGRTNKKGQEIHDIEVDPYEAEFVKLIYTKYVHEGLGLLRLSEFLNQEGIRNRRGKLITHAAVRVILQNTIYIGIMTCGEVSSDVIPELRIVEDDLFQQAQKLRKERADAAKARTLPLQTKGQALLAGNVFCACCGGRLNLSVYRQSYTRKSDGVLVESKLTRYVCYNRTRRLRDCDNQVAYSMIKVDGMIAELLAGLFRNIKDATESELIEKSYLSELQSCKTKLKGTKTELHKHTKNLKTLQGEVVAAIQGTSKFDPSLLNDLIQQTKVKVDMMTGEVARYTAELENGQQQLETITADYQKLISWSEIFQDSNIETKKMITAYLIKSVKVHRGYELDIQFNLAFEQFFNAG